MTASGQGGSQAVDRAATLLTLVVEAEEPRTFTSLVDELGLAKSTTSRLLQALERNRLVQRDRAGSFRPGPVFAMYAARHDAVQDLVETAQPALDRLAEETGETVNFAVPRAGAVMQLAQIDSRYLLGATNWVGVDVPPHCSALGKVFYAYGAISRPEGDLERCTPGSLVTRGDLDAELAEVTRRGWAASWEELEPGLVSVAAPVRAAGGAVVAAVSVAGPTARITRPSLTPLGELLLAEARALSAALGHRQPEPSEGPGRHEPHEHDGKEGAA